MRPAYLSVQGGMEAADVNGFKKAGFIRYIGQ